MNQRATEERPLQGTGYVCKGGPLDGATLFLTEHSGNSAWIKFKNWHGVYLLGRWSRGEAETLIWQTK